MEGKYLTAVQYYKWVAEAEKLYKNEAKAKLVEAQMSILQLQAQNAKLKESLYAHEVAKAKKVDEKAKADFEQFMLTLAADAGVDLKNKSINPETFEIVDL